MSKRFTCRRLLLVAAAIFVLDQLTKLWVIDTLEFGAFHPPDAIEVIPGWFHIVHVGNTGAAWSLFEGKSAILAGIGIAALFAIWLFRKALELHRPMNQLAFGLIVGGIVGNVLDRIRHGHVVDFLDFHYKSHHWPSFNVADSALTIGVGIYIVASFLQPSSGSEKNDPGSP